MDNKPSKGSLNPTWFVLAAFMVVAAGGFILTQDSPLEPVGSALTVSPTEQQAAQESLANAEKARKQERQSALDAALPKLPETHQISVDQTQSIRAQADALIVQTDAVLREAGYTPSSQAATPMQIPTEIASLQARLDTLTRPDN